ncbi:hypothetical protein OAK35_04380, partial [Crocinitomicaceae bacterium]|nr:hypothetical protein [Crocinitomicaceae bacterium]
LAEKTTIHAFISYDGYRAKISTGLQLPTRFWNAKKQRVKESMEYPSSALINHDLKKIEDALLEVYQRQHDEGIILTPNEFKQEFLSSKRSPVKVKRINSFWGYFEEFIAYKKKHLADIRDYDKSLRKHFNWCNLHVETEKVWLVHIQWIPNHIFICGILN